MRAPHRVAALAAWLLLAAAAGAAPATGHYDGTLCVSAATQAPSCGPAAVEVRAGGVVRVQVADIVYRLHLRTGVAAVVVTQGTMQIDGFEAGTTWTGAALHFADADKQVRYELQLGAARGLPK